MTAPDSADATLEHADFSSPDAAPIDMDAVATPGAPKPRKLAKLIVPLVAFAGGWLVWQVWQGRSPQAPPMPMAVSVQLESVESGTVQSSAEFVGSLEAVQRVSLRSEVEGRLAELLVSAGDRVTAGTPIVQMRPDRTQSEVNAAIANVGAARSARNSAQAELLALQSERDRARAEVVLQTEEFQRTQRLVAEGVQSRQSLDLVVRSRDAAEADLTAAERRISAAQSSLESANASLAQAEASANAAQADLSDYRITTPIDGIVGDIPAKVGDYFDAGDLVTTVTQNDALELRLAVPIEQSVRLKAGLPVELGVPQSPVPLATGEISFVSPRVDTQAQVVLAKARFDNPEGRLRDEQFVEARVIWDESDGVTIPATAITYIGNQAFVYVAQPNENADPDNPDAPQQVAEQRPIQLGAIRGNQYQVLDGLDAGEAIVTSGLLNLTNGVPIVPQTQERAETATSPQG